MADPYSPNINANVNSEGLRNHILDWANQVSRHATNYRQFTIRYRQHHYHVVGLSLFITGGATPRLPRRSAAVARIGSGKDPHLYLLGRYAKWSPHYGRVPDDWPNLMRLIEHQWTTGRSVRCYHPGQCRGFHKNNAAVFDETLTILLGKLKRTRKWKIYYINAIKGVVNEADAYTAATGHSMDTLERHDYLVEVFHQRVTANA
jgi:hypothetical protein